MRKLILENYQSPGDILMLTAAVRDLPARHYTGGVSGEPGLLEANGA